MLIGEIKPVVREKIRFNIQMSQVYQQFLKNLHF